MISHEKATLINSKLSSLDSKLVYPPQNLVDLVNGDFFTIDTGGCLAGFGGRFGFVSATGSQGGGNDDGQQRQQTKRALTGKDLLAGLHGYCSGCVNGEQQAVFSARMHDLVAAQKFPGGFLWASNECTGPRCQTCHVSVLRYLNLSKYRRLPSLIFHTHIP